MQVTLLYHTNSPERAVATAARLCYSPIGAAELMETMSDSQVDKVLATIMRSGHFSALEHASYTFAIDGVSRALTHQLVRHRMASYNQQSQRYVACSGEPEVVLPQSIAADAEAHAAFRTAIDIAYATYAQLIEAGIPAEDARSVLPNACTSKIVVTMNIRELLHFFEVRCCHRAQQEIQELACRMLDLVEPTAPYIFMDSGAPCRRGPCTEGKMTCGQSFEKVIRP
ncbi:MAG: FAD-dependent thymidylate synthase [Coriobacteriales bacterium]|jgi:thymidylate synthase (FAD)|nr:FAD-dependent thymidylate synthase [Coriobacteriales bacterium]